ncbi:MIP family channel protein [alpha proteobacterium AAP81b]|nr:MIP family channel protein [alpha proteobacterium AAP81b]
MGGEGPALARRLAAEALGTLLLLAVVVGSGIQAEALAGGSVAVALLANTVATGAGLVVLITLLGPISGAHFNPAVSLVAAARGELPWRVVPAYLLVQVAGAIAGVWLAHLMFVRPLLEVSVHLRDGPAQWLAEAVATAGLVLTILGGVRHRAEAVPMLVGLYITAAYWFTASTSFANPAVTVARALTDSFAGIAPVSVPGFLAGQAAGALVGALLGHWLFDEEPPR